MKVSAFTFLRNGTLLGYPYIESIKSILPIVDEFVVNVGKGEDDTLDRVKAIGDPKIKIVESTWNEKMQDRGYVYGQQKMIAHFNCTGDWAFYLEGDEVVHENDLEKIRSCMQENLFNKSVEAIVFDYHHFLAADTLGISPDYYHAEARIIRNTIRTYHPDGLFFLVLEKNKIARYPKAVHCGAHIYHYGHARLEENIKRKNKAVGKYWGVEHPEFSGHYVDPKATKRFDGSHPAVIHNWLKNSGQQVYVAPQRFKPSRKERRYRIEMYFEKILGISFSKKHFKLID